MTRTTKTAMRKAVNKVFALVKEGHSVTKARTIIGHEVDVSANTLWSWQDRLNLTTPTTGNKIAKTNNNIVIPRQDSINSGISNMKNQLGNVFTSLVSKDGRYTTKEASAISQVSSNILGLARFELEVHKYADKMQKRDNTVKSLLM